MTTMSERLEEDGYKVVLCVGVRPDGAIKVAGVSELRCMSREAYAYLCTQTEKSLVKLFNAPLDDLERDECDS